MTTDDMLLGDVNYVATMTVGPDTARALRTAGAKVTEWTARRDDLIRQAVAEGGTLRAVGELAGMSHMAVSFIANGRPAKG